MSDLDAEPPVARSLSQGPYSDCSRGLAVPHDFPEKILIKAVVQLHRSREKISFMFLQNTRFCKDSSLHFYFVVFLFVYVYMWEGG